MTTLAILFLLIICLTEVDRVRKLNHSTCTKNANVKVSHECEPVEKQTSAITFRNQSSHLALESFCIANTNILVLS